ncbi:hypothetical protein M3584_11085 [Bacillus safensis]|uniref:hypothetical protein n=1 Tax=Bacillus safensis TaxID=561879 RepID=UPI00203FCDDC|nr:hypothetical protein [Bacillus safensis]MCM3027412.1 hypothetical protein [Bacillus safensis]
MDLIVTFIFGLITTFITSFLLKLLDRKEYKNKVEIANSELNKTLKYFISEGESLNIPLIETLCLAYSQSYKIKSRDMNKAVDVINHLIKEVFETSFLSSSQKSTISAELLELKELSTTSNHLDNLNNDTSGDTEKSIPALITWAIGTFVTYLITFVCLEILNLKLNFLMDDNPNYLLIILTISGVITFLIMMSTTIIPFRKK